MPKRLRLSSPRGLWFAAALAGPCLVALIRIASAQAPATTPASPLTPVPTMPSPSAPAAGPSAESIALGRDIIVGSGIARSLDAIVPQFLDQIGTQVTQTRPDLIRDLNDVMAQIKPDFDKQTQGMITDAARVYAQLLTDKQLREISDFFKSPAGIAYVASQPRVMDGLFGQMQAFSQRISTEMMTRVRTEMKKRGHEL